MPEASLEGRFALLCQIVRAQHFAWRAAVAEVCPGVDPARVVQRMWEITGADTARAYARRLDPEAPLAPQVAAWIAESSRAMGETVEVEAGPGPDEALVRHTACPWREWHARKGLLAEDRPACDRWFAATLEGLGRALGVRLAFETLESLPEGGSCCARRLTAGDARSGGPR